MVQSTQQVSDVGATDEESDDAPLPFVTNDMPPPPIMERRLAREMAMQERNQLLDEIHGVFDLPPESPEFVSRCLSAMDGYLRDGVVVAADGAFGGGREYRQALAQNAAYVRDRAFLLMFLRAELYDPRAAADRLLLHFSFKKRLFGEEKLTKDIELEDLNYGDLYTLHSGYIQVLPIVDNSGRSITMVRIPLMRYYTMENIMKTFWYVGMNLLRQELAQLRGTVVVGHNDGVNNEKDLSFLQMTGMVRQAIPLRTPANHLFIFNPDDVPAMDIIPYFLERTSRLRFRGHYVENQNQMFEKLRGFGISMMPFQIHQLREAPETIAMSRILRLQESIRRRRAQLQLQEKAESGDSTEQAARTNARRLDAMLSGKRNVAGLLLPKKERPSAATDLVVTAADDSTESTGPSSAAGPQPCHDLETSLSATRDVVDASDGGTEDVLVVPRPEDVLLGRGLCREHPGTKYLMRLVEDRLEEYFTAARFEKGKIVRQIVQAIRESGGRFLKRTMENDEDWDDFGETVGVVRGWLEVDEKLAIKKVTNLIWRTQNK